MNKTYQTKNGDYLFDAKSIEYSDYHKGLGNYYSFVFSTLPSSLFIIFLSVIAILSIIIALLL
jgi:hypothetical protein